ncbi:MAG: molybdenum cofactor guanylyltransferase, partial [Candidatus Zixiibacteriota bacterium]
MDNLSEKRGGFVVRSAYVLAGGQSRRMSGDKLFLEINGKSLLKRTLEVCRSRFDEVWIVAKESEKFAGLDYPVVIDWPGADGPLAGIIAALSDCTESACFVTAADLYDL